MRLEIDETDLMLVVRMLGQARLDFEGWMCNCRITERERENCREKAKMIRTAENVIQDAWSEAARKSINEKINGHYKTAKEGGAK